MSNESSEKRRKRFVRVKDGDGNEFVCPIDALKNPDELSDEEKGRCMESVGARGLVSPPLE
jgi:hypothetical protein